MDASTTHYPKPTIVFVPGAFHTSAHFEPISALLNQASFPTTTVEIPTTARAKTASYRDDVYAIRSLLERLVEEDGKEVLLALHSYGGVPGCQTVSGLERSKRKAEGKPGGVIHVLFIAALLVEQGQGMAAALEGGKAPPWAVFKVRKGLTSVVSRMACNTISNRMVFFTLLTRRPSSTAIFLPRMRNIGILCWCQSRPVRRLLMWLKCVMILMYRLRICFAQMILCLVC